MDIEEYSKYRQFYTEEIPGLLAEYLHKKNWNTFLDLGCGDGSLLYALNKKDYFKNKIVYATDLSKNRVGLAQKINKKFLCFVDDACNIKNIRNNSIDFLIANQLIEHVKDDEKMIKEIEKVLSEKGIVYLSTVFKKWYGWYFYRCCGKWTLDPTHLREYSKDSQLVDILEKNNLEVLEVRKTLIKRSLVEFILKRTGAEKNIFASHPFLEFLKKINIPIFGYYNWEIICQKK